MENASRRGIQVIAMIGGAGGGYSSLFANYAVAYPLLREMLASHLCITGIDLDIEESVSLSNVQQLIRDIKHDFPDYTISMAPIQSSLQNDIPGMGGFVYKDLYQSDEGQYIDYFNVQFYSDFSVCAYQEVIHNGYPAHKVVMGSLCGSGSIDVIAALSRQYTDFGGVYSWEYYNTVPSPQDWARAIFAVLHPDPLVTLVHTLVSLGSNMIRWCCGT